MDLESLIQRAVTLVLRDHGFRLPVNAAAVAADGSVLFSRFSPGGPGQPHGAATQEHVTGHFENDGFPPPIHLMLTDAVGAVRVARLRGAGEPVILQLVEPDGA